MFEDVEKLNSQAIHLASSGDYSDAIACFKRAISMENSNYLLWYNLGITFRDAGKLDEAIAAVKNAHELNTEDAEVIETLAVLLFQSGKDDEASEYCLKGIAINNLNSHLWNTIGVIFFNKANFKKAAESFEHAVTLNPYYYDALYNLKDTYEELGNRIGMDECLSKMKSISSGDYYAR